jgi:hypothetical protein
MPHSSDNANILKLWKHHQTKSLIMQDIEKRLRVDFIEEGSKVRKHWLSLSHLTPKNSIVDK